ncbi:universal stress protein [Beggiatoa alba]|nr:universal stress protein [Beggiatoa alba]
MYKHILFATDLNTDTVSVARHAVELAQLFQARLSLAHVVTGLDTGVMLNLAPQVLTEMDLIQVQDAHQRMESLVRELGETQLTDKWLLNSGPVALQIHRLAVEQEVDLIVVASHGQHGFFKLFGSEATDILEASSCNVLVVKI